jgi:hypothetical protein
MDPVPPGASFAFDAGIRTLDEQLHRIDALDTKAGVLLAAAGVLSGFLLADRSSLAQAPKAVGMTAIVVLIIGD